MPKRQEEVSKPFEDGVQAAEADEAFKEFGIVFLACDQAAEVMQPANCARFRGRPGPCAIRPPTGRPMHQGNDHVSDLLSPTHHAIHEPHSSPLRNF